VRNLIREGKTYQIPSAMQTGKKYGMQTLDDAIMELLTKGWISGENAYINAIDKSKFVQFLKKPPAILLMPDAAQFRVGRHSRRWPSVVQSTVPWRPVVKTVAPVLCHSAIRRCSTLRWSSETMM
jgi:hypothetical protein